MANTRPMPFPAWDGCFLFFFYLLFGTSRLTSLSAKLAQGWM